MTTALVGLLHFAFLFITALIVGRALLSRSPAPLPFPMFIVGALVLTLAQIVLVVQALSLFSAVTATYLLIAHAVLSITLCLAAWRLTWRQDEHARIEPQPLAASPPPSAVQRAVNGCVFLLVFGVVCLKLFQLVQVSALPLVVGDVTTFHAPRVLFWLQHQTIEHFPAWETRMNFLPKAMAMAQLEIVALTRSLDWFELTQWVSSIVSGLCIYDLGRRLRFDWSSSLLSALVFMCLPVVVVQSITGQNDIAVTALFLAFLAFSLRAIQTAHLPTAVVAACAIALAVGTKLLILWIAIPVFVLHIYWINRYKPPIRWTMRALGIAAVATVALGSTSSVENWNHYGRLFTGPGYEDLVRPTFALKPLLVMSGRYLYQVVDPSGLPYSLAGAVDAGRQWLFGPWLPFLQSSVRGADFVLPVLTSANHPAIAWYGLVGAAVLVPLSIASLVRPRMWSDGFAMFGACMVFTFVINATTLQFTYARGRYFMMAFAMASILLAQFLSSLSIRMSRFLRPTLSVALVVFSFSSILFSVRYDLRKSGYLLDPRIKIADWSYEDSARLLLDSVIPDGSVIGLAPIIHQLRFIEETGRFSYVHLTDLEDGPTETTLLSYANSHGFDFIFFRPQDPAIYTSDFIIGTRDIAYFSRVEWSALLSQADTEALCAIGVTVPGHC